jgi:predicted nucleotide-binding protein
MTQPQSDKADSRGASNQTTLDDSRPRIFVGSSTEGLPVAEAIQVALDHFGEVTIWSQGVFGLSRGTLDELVRAVTDFDFAILVVTPDDVVTKRGISGDAPRDNVIFEIGFFMGALGRERTFVVHSRDRRPELPSDLAGVTLATYADRLDGNLQAALGSACTQIKTAVQRAKTRVRTEVVFAERLAAAEKRLEASESSREVLRNDLDRVQQLAARHEYQPLEATLREGVVRALEPIAREFTSLSAVVTVSHETWIAAPTRMFTAQLASMLRDAGFSVDGPKFATVYLVEPSHPLEWGCGKALAHLLEPMMVVLRPVMEQPTPYPVREADGTFFRLHFGGRAVFGTDGRVRLE